MLSRIPPRVRVRQDAPIELPHVMLLIDDPDRTVIEPLTAGTDTMEKLYDFDLQQGGGHLKGWKLTDTQMDAVADALTAMCTPKAMEKKYGLKNAAPLLFAVGDGNHSLATAKECYQRQKKLTPPEQWASLPARYALVELNNLHDQSLEFEPIHRVVFGAEPAQVLSALRMAYPDAREGEGDGHVIRYLYGNARGALTVPDPAAQLAVGTLQSFLDRWMEGRSGVSLDYIHGAEVVEELTRRPKAIGFLLPPMKKEELFPTVIHDGVLPRKTFSMGEAHDKRFYLEARKIRL